MSPSDLIKTSLLFLFIIGISCTEEEKIVLFEEDELIRLLTGDSTKSWLRTTQLSNGQMTDNTDCDLFLITRYYLDEADSLKYEVAFNPEFCNGDSSLVDSGIFQTVFDQRLNQNRILYINEQDTTEKDIIEITSLFLRLKKTDIDFVQEESFESFLPQN